MVMASVGIASSPDESSPSWFACVGREGERKLCPHCPQGVLVVLWACGAMAGSTLDQSRNWVMRDMTNTSPICYMFLGRGLTLLSWTTLPFNVGVASSFHTSEVTKYHLNLATQ